jgi:hypothetical protein
MVWVGFLGLSLADGGVGILFAGLLMMICWSESVGFIFWGFGVFMVFLQWWVGGGCWAVG